MTDSGYSGTPLAKKLRIKPGCRVALWRAPADWPPPAVPEGVRLDARPEEADVVLAFYRRSDDLRADADKLVTGLLPHSCLWLLWPRRAAGHASEITDNDLRELMLPLGVVDVKVAAVGEDWSGLAFVWRKENRPAR
ncbi:DUF3052 family protein [Streptacidiphilus neutrinimicus]|uniref:DUF3052 family protein n=1 Tax=Streptacidiphilus neutrinimicus TaxID=105420 RepID=UPI0005A9C0A1|nr:DUF3052 family protein [Streptacidiphilus neutrinimicus]